MTKEEFIKTLKNAPYNDEVIASWMETFEDERMVNQYLKGIRHNNSEWERVKGHYSINEFIDIMYNDLKQQGLPHGLIIPFMICSCPAIRNRFVAREFLKSVKISKINGMTVIDMSN